MDIVNELSESLVYVKRRPDKKSGICNLVAETITCHGGNMGKLLAKVMKKWPKHSGDKRYPVPSGMYGVSAEDAYEKTRDYTYRWSKHTVYGALRWELLEFCVEELKKYDVYVVTSVGATLHAEYDFNTEQGDDRFFIVVDETLVPDIGVESAIGDSLWAGKAKRKDYPFIVMKYH
jgi:hypothetical protein